LEVCAEQLTALTVPVIRIASLKSGYYFVNQLLSRLRFLQIL